MKQLYRIFPSIILLSIIGFSAKAQNKSGVYMSIEEALEFPESVKILDLSFQNISELPDRFFEFQNLQELKLVNNNLKTLPNSVYKLKHLKHLNLAGNIQIDQSSLLVGIDSLNSLEELNLSNCRLRYLESSIGECVELKSLILEGNYFFYLPSSIGNLKNLEELDLRRNLLLEIPETFFFLENLEVLKVGQNQKLAIDQLFKIIKESNIKHLQFEDQHISAKIEGEMANFTSIEFDHCSFSDSKFFDKIGSKKMVLNYCIDLDLTALFKIISKDSLLIDLQISDSISTKANIRALAGSNIQYLKLELGKIRNWNTAAIGLERMPKLESLDLSNNSIKGYPSNINKCQKLTFLNLNNCGLEDGKLNIEIAQLKSLDLRENSISKSGTGQLVNQNPKCFVYHDFMYNSVPAKNRPFPNVPQKFEVVKLNPNQPNRLSFNTGTEIFIPENAFVTKDGAPVTGEVEFAVAEFKNATDIFLSGIPMTYDSAGVSYIFSSAGMMELRAFSNNEELGLAPNTQLDIKMTSDQKGQYNLYALDDSSGAWALNETRLNNTVNFQSNTELSNNKLQNIIQDSASWYAQMVGGFEKTPKEILQFKIRPHKKLNTFKINFINRGRIQKDDGRLYFNETELLEDYTFIYEGENRIEDFSKLQNILAELRENFYAGNKKQKTRPTAVSSDSLKIIEDLRLEPNPNSDNFRMTIIYDSQKLSFPVSIKTKSRKPRSVQKEYAKFYAKYNKVYSRRVEKWGVIERIWEANLKSYIDDMWAGLRRKGFVDNNGDVSIPRSVFSFGIGGLGVINCDKPLPRLLFNPLERVLANFYDLETQKKLHHKQVYVLDYSQNYALNYYKRTPRAYKKSKVILVVLMKNGDYGIVYDLDKARKTKDRKGKFKFPIKLFDNSTHFNERLAPYAASLN